MTIRAINDSEEREDISNEMEELDRVNDTQTTFTSQRAEQTKTVNFKQIATDMLPKTLILMHLDKSFAKAMMGCNFKNDASKEAVLTIAKKYIVARAVFIHSTDNLSTSLQTLEASVSESIENQRAILSEHRGRIHKTQEQSAAQGRDFINPVLDFMRKMRGYVAFVITYPGRICYEKEITTFVDSYFKSPEPSSLRHFSMFKEEAKADSLEKVINDLKPRP